MDPSGMVVEPGYDGPKLADEENPVVTIEFVREMVERFKDQKVPWQLLFFFFFSWHLFSFSERSNVC